MKYAAAATMILLLFACKKNEEYPVEPIISLKSFYTLRDFSGYDTTAVIELNFTDGDGDIGLRASDVYPPFDTGSIYYRNFQVEFYRWVDGAWQLDPNSVYMGGRIPYLTPTGSNKALKGEIRMDSFLPFGLTGDTCYMNVFIYDRALHKSNVVQTPNIVLTTH
jgi:hypothetical protein